MKLQLGEDNETSSSAKSTVIIPAHSFIQRRTGLAVKLSGFISYIYLRFSVHFFPSLPVNPIFSSNASSSYSFFCQSLCPRQLLKKKCFSSCCTVDLM